MIIDSSTLIAILTIEEDADLYMDALTRSDIRLLSAASFVEAGIIIDRRKGAEAGRQFDALLSRAEIVIEPVTERHARVARQAYIEYGKGAHPAGLNYRDCFSYALAKTTGLPLLYKGNDFNRTDIESALGSQ